MAMAQTACRRSLSVAPKYLSKARCRLLLAWLRLGEESDNVGAYIGAAVDKHMLTTIHIKRRSSACVSMGVGYATTVWAKDQRDTVAANERSFVRDLLRFLVGSW